MVDWNVINQHLLFCLNLIIIIVGFITQKSVNTSKLCTMIF